MRRMIVALVGACVLATMTACPDYGRNDPPPSPLPSSVKEGDECTKWYAQAVTADGIEVQCSQGTLDTKLRWRRYGPLNHPHG